MHARTTALTAVAALTLSLGPGGTGHSGAAARTADRPGDLVSSAPTAFRRLPGQPTPTRAWHIKYRSTTAKGAPNTVSGTVLVPTDGSPGPRPLITYAVGTVGLADSCAPSAGFPRGTTAEADLIQLLTLRGWAVAVTDYEGLGTPGVHTYTVGPAEGRAVLDAARAAERLPGTGLSKDTPVGIMGYSQGGQASGWAAELHASYAPELNVKGTAAGGVPADLLKVAAHNHGSTGAGLVLMSAIGQNAAFPELRLDAYLNERGRRYVDLMKRSCVAIDTVAGLFREMSDVTVRDPLRRPAWQRALHASDLGARAPDRPVYLYHGTADQLIPYAVGDRLRADWCARRAAVAWRPIPLGEHVAGAISGSVPAANWLADRFADRPPHSDC
ncbi:lipase family protein [Streptomyces sp. NPDC050610]|uniref:lipase family protein n=1 Tax=Streptomyces sp. NPDC050610 TaxID=3157097 RepID=UPI0034454264